MNTADTCAIVAIILAGVVELLVGIAATTPMRPANAQCPDGWHVSTGIRRTGEFACSAPLPACCGAAKGPCSEVECPETWTIKARIYCTGGTQPIVVDERTVGCQR